MDGGIAPRPQLLDERLERRLLMDERLPDQSLDAPRQIDPDTLAKFFGGLGVEPVSTGSGPDHRIITRDEIDPRFVVAPVTQAV